eukprot:g6185.t1
MRSSRRHRQRSRSRSSSRPRYSYLLLFPLLIAVGVETTIEDVIPAKTLDKEALVRLTTDGSMISSKRRNEDQGLALVMRVTLIDTITETTTPMTPEGSIVMTWKKRRNLSLRNREITPQDDERMKEIRMVMDKYTNAPRGFAFAHFFSVADASRALHTFQGCAIETQLTPIKLCYARDRVAPTSTSAAAAAAIEAAQSMQQYASWEPTEFDEAATELLDNETEKAQEQEVAGETLQDPSGGFTYDPNSGTNLNSAHDIVGTSGYYYHEASGYYYNASTGMYYNGVTGEWLVFDQGRNEYVPYVAPEITTAGQSAIESTNYAMEAIKNAEEKPKKRTGAIIGAKPQLKPESVALVLKAEQEEKLMKDSLKKLQEERQKAIANKNNNVQDKSVQKSETSFSEVAAPRVKGVIRGGKYRGNLVQNNN